MMTALKLLRALVSLGLGQQFIYHGHINKMTSA